nr:excalibur calcium-binding domain-containing protein [Sphingomonas colocasiae]
MGWVISGTAETQPQPAPALARGFIDHGVKDRSETLRRAEAAEPPETLSGTMAAAGGMADAGGAVDEGAGRSPARAAAAFYRYCADARRAGAAPLYRGEPGYRDALDRDGDGIACEPYSGR